MEKQITMSLSDYDNILAMEKNLDKAIKANTEPLKNEILELEKAFSYGYTDSLSRRTISYFSKEDIEETIIRKVEELVSIRETSLDMKYNDQVAELKNMTVREFKKWRR